VLFLIRLLLLLDWLVTCVTPDFNDIRSSLEQFERAEDMLPWERAREGLLEGLEEGSVEAARFSAVTFFELEPPIVVGRVVGCSVVWGWRDRKGGS